MNGFGPMLKDYLDYYKISQTDFADRLGISNKHMNEIINGNTAISENIMLAISLLTDIDVNLIFFVENKRKVSEYLNNNFKNNEEINNFLDSFYLKEMVKKQWIILKDKTSLIQNTMDLLDYLNVRDFKVFDNYLEKRILFKKSNDANKRKIYLWIKHCDKIITNQVVNEYHSSYLNLLLEDLKIERNKPFSEERLIKLFNKYGIYLVIEEPLTSSKIRGCMMVKETNPVIYMTKYLKEKSSFYFALYHELGHVKTDYNKAKNKIIVDDEETEEKADAFALNAMIDDKLWPSIINNPINREKICLENNIPLSFLYTRLAYQGYIKYNSKEYQSHREKLF